MSVFELISRMGGIPPIVQKEIDADGLDVNRGAVIPKHQPLRGPISDEQRVTVRAPARVRFSSAAGVLVPIPTLPVRFSPPPMRPRPQVHARLIQNRVAQIAVSIHSGM